MLTHNDWSAWVTMNGQELPHYKDSVNQDVTVTPIDTQVTYNVSCWIASEEGKEFSVHIKNETHIPPVPELAVYLYMDGRNVGGRCLQTGIKMPVTIAGQVSTDGKTELPFVFSRLVLTDDDSALHDVFHLKDLGTIRIDLRRIKVLPGMAVDTTGVSQCVPTEGPVHETSKKAGAHRVSFGKAREVQYPHAVQVSCLDKKSFLTFEFRYRPAELLRALDIMPPISKPVPHPEVAPRSLKRQRVTSTAVPSAMQRKVKIEQAGGGDAGDEVEMQIKILRAKLKSLEKRRDKENGEGQANKSAKKLKLEPFDFSKLVDGEVIDLT